MTATQPEAGATHRDTLFRDLKRSEGLVDTAFVGCTFEGIRWREIALHRCRFVACTFLDSDLSLVDLEGSVLRDVSFDACSLTGINWASAVSTMHDPFGVDFRGCVLNFGIFQGRDLRRRRIDLCVAHECDFRDADLTDAVCRGTDFAGSDFTGADLSGADLSRARNYAIDVRNTRVAGARFSSPEVMALLAGLEIEIEDAPVDEEPAPQAPNPVR